jgi:orotidine-5'-phosphate decarboxylase
MDTKRPPAGVPEDPNTTTHEERETPVPTQRSKMSPHERIIFALDVPRSDDAEKFSHLLAGQVGGFKIGLELFIAAGPAVFDRIGPNVNVMLDLKLHDIPETVERAVHRVGELSPFGVKFLTLHVQQRETMRRAVKAAEKSGVQLLGVTVLTSMTDTDLKDFCYEGDTLGAVLSRAKLAAEEGITGFVTSPREVALLRRAYPNAVLVTPGIRPTGSEESDQKRIGTPGQAVEDGADYLVVGRPIRDADNPVAMAGLIAAEIELKTG